MNITQNLIVTGTPLYIELDVAGKAWALGASNLATVVSGQTATATAWALGASNLATVVSGETATATAWALGASNLATVVSGQTATATAWALGASNLATVVSGQTATATAWALGASNLAVAVSGLVATAQADATAANTNAEGRVSKSGSGGVTGAFMSGVPGGTAGRLSVVDENLTGSWQHIWFSNSVPHISSTYANDALMLTSAVVGFTLPTNVIVQWDAGSSNVTNVIVQTGTLKVIQ